MAEKHKALRYNSGKIMHELIPAKFLDDLAKVYTMGAEKYAADNWRQGFSWTKALGSIKRHINKFERGEDFDYDWSEEILEKYGPTLHLANAAWGLSVLLEYYKIYPEGDDRKHNHLVNKRIGLDIDEVLCDWLGDWTEHRKLDRPTSWHFDRGIVDEFERMKDAGELDKFYLSLQPLISPTEIPFEPHCYITSRPVESSISEQWLDTHGFPTRPVFTVEPNKSKVDIAIEQKLDIFVDDGYHNFVALNKAGICCFLYDAPHNQRYDVGYKRIKSIKELL